MSFVFSLINLKYIGNKRLRIDEVIVDVKKKTFDSKKDSKKSIKKIIEKSIWMFVEN